MLNPKLCSLEDIYEYEEGGCTVYYFTYPKDMNLREFDSEEEYGNVVAMCISVTEYDNGCCEVQASPTVADGEMLSDVDWRDLEEGIHYTENALDELLWKARLK